MALKMADVNLYVVFIRWFPCVLLMCCAGTGTVPLFAKIPVTQVPSMGKTLEKTTCFVWAHMPSWHIFWHTGVLSDISSWDSVWHSIYLDLFGISFGVLTGSQSGIGIWSPWSTVRVPQCPLRVRHCPLGSGARGRCGSGPAVPIGIWSSQYTVASQQDPLWSGAGITRWRRRRRRGRRVRRRRQLVIKSNNPHGADGKKERRTREREREGKCMRIMKIWGRTLIILYRKSPP